MATTWTISVDWQRTGAFTNLNDNITDYVISANWFVGFRKPYQDAADDTMLKINLNNAERRFSPENSTSPLFDYIAPFRPVRVQSFDGTTTRTHYFGWIEKVKPMVNQYGGVK